MNFNHTGYGTEVIIPFPFPFSSTGDTAISNSWSNSYSININTKEINQITVSSYRGSSGATSDNYKDMIICGY